jgi:hypothetical protein
MPSAVIPERPPYNVRSIGSLESFMEGGMISGIYSLEADQMTR